MSEDLKYELLFDNVGFIGSTKVYRIRALKDFADVKKGDLGGYVSGYNNLTHQGTSWVYGPQEDQVAPNATAYVIGSSVVMEHAVVFDTASVSGESILAGHCRIGGDCTVHSCFIDGKAQILEDALLQRSEIRANSVVRGSGEVLQSTLTGNVLIDQGASVEEYSLLAGRIRVIGISRVTESILKGIVSVASAVKLDNFEFIGDGYLNGDLNFTDTQFYGNIQMDGVMEFDNCSLELPIGQERAWKFDHGEASYRSRKFTENSFADQIAKYRAGGVPVQNLDSLKARCPTVFSKNYTPHPDIAAAHA